MAVTQLELAAPRVCTDPEKEKMWAIAMKLTNAEKLVMGSLCLTFMAGQKAGLP